MYSLHGLHCEIDRGSLEGLQLRCKGALIWLPAAQMDVLQGRQRGFYVCLTPLCMPDACLQYCRRMKWRKQQPITVLELRCRRLDQPLTLLQDSSFYGCFSWVDLYAQCKGAHGRGRDVINDSDFREKQCGLRAALQVVDATPVEGRWSLPWAETSAQ